MTIVLEYAPSQNYNLWMDVETFSDANEALEALKSPTFYTTTGDILRLDRKFYIAGATIREATRLISPWFNDKDPFDLFNLYETLFSRDKLVEFLEKMISDLPKWSKVGFGTKINHYFMSKIEDFTQSDYGRVECNRCALMAAEYLERYKESTARIDSNGTSCLWNYAASYASEKSGNIDVRRMSLMGQKICDSLRNHFGSHEFSMAVLRRLES